MELACADRCMKLLKRMMANDKCNIVGGKPGDLFGKPLPCPEPSVIWRQ